jgi:hypothetical protein
MSQMQMEAVVKAVEPRDITVQGVARKVYDVVDQTGTKYTAWERELAERAYALKDQSSVWKVKVEQKGQYTNRNLVDIAAKLGGGMDAALGAGSSGFPETVKPVTFDQPGSVITPKDTFIHRQVSVKAVAVLAGAGGMTPDEFWANVQAVTNYIETGQTPMGGNAEQTFAAEFPQADDDIPFS